MPPALGMDLHRLLTIRGKDLFHLMSEILAHYRDVHLIVGDKAEPIKIA